MNMPRLLALTFVACWHTAPSMHLHAQTQTIAPLEHSQSPAPQTTAPQTTAPQTAIPQSAATQSVNSLLSTYCVDCHNGDAAEANLNLDSLDFASLSDSHHAATQSEATDIWEKVAKRLVARQMPPADASRPTEAEYQQAISELHEQLDALAEESPKPGRTEPIRRLNRTEYGNAIRDLLSLDVDVSDMLPADQSGHGFDNVTVGELPPLLLSRYISAAEKISRMAVGGKLKSPAGYTLRLPADRTQEHHVPGLPLGTRGGTVFDYQFPASGEYEIQLRLMRDRDENVEGLNGTYEIDVLIDRVLKHQFSVSAPKKQETWQKDDTLVDAHLKKRFQVDAGPHSVGVTFPVKSLALQEINRQPFEASFNRHRHPRRSPAIYEVSIVGPLDDPTEAEHQEMIATPSRERIFVARPKSTLESEQMACAKEIFSSLLRMAYRRPTTDADLSVPMRFFESRLSEDGFEAGIESGLASILVNPHFLFRAETDPPNAEPGTAYALSDIELASRLSFFLWSSIPDAELLDLAASNRLSEPATLSKQVARMLADPRAESLVTNFAAQWLYLRNLSSFRPDMRRYPGFDDNLRTAMRRETELHFETLLSEDRSVLDLIDTDVTYLNERLAQHYGIPGVFGSHFRQVRLDPATTKRGGLLRQASILSVTSYATRTAPTIRGNWILENILGTPAPPPPPNIPSLKEEKAAAPLTVRERLAEHRRNPACASCHDLMDPVGFALENYDAVGKWRNFENGIKIDSAGALPDGTEIDSVADLESGIAARPELFVSTLVSKLMTFGLGRGIEPHDGPAIRKIVQQSANKDYRFSSLIDGIVQSTPFRMRTSAK